MARQLVAGGARPGRHSARFNSECGSHHWRSGSGGRSLARRRVVQPNRAMGAAPTSRVHSRSAPEYRCSPRLTEVVSTIERRAVPNGIDYCRFATQALLRGRLGHPLVSLVDSHTPTDEGPCFSSDAGENQHDRFVSWKRQFPSDGIGFDRNVPAFDLHLAGLRRAKPLTDLRRVIW